MKKNEQQGILFEAVNLSAGHTRIDWQKSAT